jgi:hypothetical protein
MLVGESDSYAGAIGRPDRDERIVARLSEYRCCLVGLRHFWHGSRFAGVDRGQLLLMPPSLVGWLPEDHLVWTVLGAVDRMDLGCFAERYWLGAAGRAPFDPAVIA